MVQFLSINFFFLFLQFLLGFSKVPVFWCHPVFATTAYYPTWGGGGAPTIGLLNLHLLTAVVTTLWQDVS